MDVKQPISYEEQVQYIEKKGFLIEDEEKSLQFLKKANYYNE